MKKLIILQGPTGIGKTDISIQIAKILNTEIISADSRQIYKELKIGTAPPSEEQLNTIKHYFIANKSIFDYYNASMYELEVIDLLNILFQKYDNLLLVGGSGMYIDALCYGIDDLPNIDQEIRKNLSEIYENQGIETLRIMLKKLDPQYYDKVDLKNPKRILKGLEITMMTGKPYTSFLTNAKKKRDFQIIKIGLNTDREKLHNTINLRVDKMVENGLIEEATVFYPNRNLNALNTVGYKEIFEAIDNKYDMTTAIELIKRNTRRYARRQLTWFNKDKNVQWFEPQQLNQILDFIAS